MKSFKQYYKELTEKIIFDNFKDKAHFWPEVKGWTVTDTDKTSMGTAAKITLRDFLTNVLVTLDASALQQGKKGDGTVEFTYFGKTVYSTFSHIEDVPDLFKDIQKELPKIRETQIKRIPKSVAGWKLEDPINDFIVYKRKIDHTKTAVAAFHDIGEIMAGGRGEVNMHIADTMPSSDMSPEVAQPSVPNTARFAMGLDDIPKFLKKFNKELEK